MGDGGEAQRISVVTNSTTGNRMVESCDSLAVKIQQAGKDVSPAITPKLYQHKKLVKTVYAHSLLVVFNKRVLKPI